MPAKVILRTTTQTRVVIATGGSSFSASNISYDSTNTAGSGVTGPSVQDAVEQTAALVSSAGVVYSVPYTSTSSVVVSHTLARYPLVQVIDSSGFQLEASVRHVSTSQFVVDFNEAASGTILYI